MRGLLKQSILASALAQVLLHPSPVTPDPMFTMGGGGYSNTPTKKGSIGAQARRAQRKAAKKAKAKSRK